MGVTITDNSGAFLARLTEAVDGSGGGLDAATQFLAGKITESMYLSGAGGVPNDTPTKLQPPSAPGTPPSVKTGRLANSFTNARVGTLRWAAGTNVEYAKIHEFGGVINHPGGTAYIMVGGRFQPVRNENAKPWMKRTKPHAINMPARPFMRPALRNNKAALGRVFAARVRRLMKAAGGAA
jgi:phage gpG-like protein